MNTYARDQAIAFIDSWLEYQSRQMDVPGFVVAIQHRDQQLLLRAYGLANRERNEPMHTNHRFGIASQSKMFTGTAIMQLVEAGKLSLDDHVVTYLPWMREHNDQRVHDITLRHLLRHGAGLLRDGQNTDFWQLLRPLPDEAELRRQVLGASLVARPGGKMKYSSLGYGLLGLVITAVTKQSYYDYTTQHIIQPLGLDATTPDYTPAIDSTIATGHTRVLDRQRFALPTAVYSQALAPLFGWHSTASDLCRFMQAQFHGDQTLISDESKALLHNSQRRHWIKPEERGSDYSLGFMSHQLGKRRVTGHGGVYIGHRTCAYADLDNELAVIVLTNARDAPTNEMMQGIFSVFDYFEQHATQPTPMARQRLNERLMSFWATYQLVATHDRIVSVLPDQWLPFANPEELEWINPNTLMIAKTSDLAAEKELIHITFQGDRIASLNYAGTTMVPERQYWSQGAAWLPEDQRKNLA